ncbi:MAG: oxygen-dependent coproporphyrinogen oxidase [Rickettsiales bacterium]
MVDDRKLKAANWFEELRTNICNEFEKIEKEVGASCKFTRKTWDREGGGGGVMAYMNGEVFEKVGVNVSTVWGEFDPKFSKDIPGTESNRNFWASGISLVAHPTNPFVPTVHMNTRMIITEKSWFGGGADLTPTIEFEDDTHEFHAAMKSACDKHNPTYYPKYKEECDKYFYIAHRNEPRGVGGIFYDYLNTGNWDNDFAFNQDVGSAFLNIYPQLVRKHYKTPYTINDKERQLFKRGRYVEFNLIYDRGTKFGLMTGGNTEAILMSMPPEVRWKVAV